MLAIDLRSNCVFGIKKQDRDKDSSERERERQGVVEKRAREDRENVESSRGRKAEEDEKQPMTRSSRGQEADATDTHFAAHTIAITFGILSRIQELRHQ